MWCPDGATDILHFDTSHSQGAQHILRAGQGTDDGHRVDKDLLHQHRKITQRYDQPQRPQQDGGHITARAGDHRGGAFRGADQGCPLFRGEMAGVPQVDAAADHRQGVHGDAGLDVPQQVETLRR